MEAKSDAEVIVAGAEKTAAAGAAAAMPDVPHTALPGTPTHADPLRKSVKDGHHDVKASTRSRMSLNTSEHMQVVYRDLNFSVMISKKEGGKKTMVEKRILKNVSGVFKPGRFTAILGASGAGKTSLLNLIAGEVHTGVVGGSIIVNGETVHAKKMKQLSGFVFQDDLILDTMTTREAITMSALLRLPEELTKEEKLQRVDEIINLLNLRKCQDTIIGNSSVKGVSGGERKRVAMAMEMITNPSILFLDEPTSGLDTFTAYSVVKTLKALAATGRTIVATLHQPSSEIFHLFDDLLILSDGRIMYQGAAADSVDYFSRLGFPCPTYSNPADFFFMKLLNTSNTAMADKTAPTEAATEADGKAIELKPVLSLEENMRRINGLLDSYDSSPEASRIRHIVDHPHNSGISQSMFKVQSSFMTQFSFLFLRAGRNALRNKLIVRTKFFQAIFIGLLIGLIYLNIQSRSPTSQMQDRAGSLFFLCVNNVMATAMGLVTVFAAEKAVFQREFGAGYYSLPSYFFSKIMVETPFQIVFPFMLSCIVYWLVGYQNDVQKFFIFATVIVLLANCGFGIGIMAASAFDDLPVALAIVPLILLTLMIFSGLFVNSGSIPVYFNWIKYLSPAKYGFQALIKNEYRGLMVPVQLANGTVAYQDGGVIVESLGLNDGLEIWSCLLVLLGLYIFVMGGAYLGLFRIVWKRVHPTLQHGAAPSAART